MKCVDKYGIELAVGDTVLMDGWHLELGVITRFTKCKIGVWSVFRSKSIKFAADGSYVLDSDGGYMYDYANPTYPASETLLTHTSRLLKINDQVLYGWPDQNMRQLVIEKRGEVLRKQDETNANE